MDNHFFRIFAKHLLTNVYQTFSLSEHLATISYHCLPNILELFGYVFFLNFWQQFEENANGWEKIGNNLFEINVCHT